MSEFTKEEEARILDTYNSALASAARTFHGESRAAQQVAMCHAQITAEFIRIEKRKAQQATK